MQPTHPVKVYLASYRLVNGARGTLHVLAAHSFDVIDQVTDLFGVSVCRLSVRPA